MRQSRTHLRDAGRKREASAAFDRARQLCEAMVAANPTDPKFAHELARTLGNWTTSLPDDGSNALVSTTLDRARKFLGAVSEANPTNLILQADLAWIDTLIGNRLKSAGRHAEAMEAYKRALAARERLSTANPTSTRHIGQRIGLHRMIGSGSMNRPGDRPMRGCLTNGGE